MISESAEWILWRQSTPWLRSDGYEMRMIESDVRTSGVERRCSQIRRPGEQAVDGLLEETRLVVFVYVSIIYIVQHLIIHMLIPFIHKRNQQGKSS